MNVDQRIKSELERESSEIDRILGEDKGIVSMMSHSLKGNLGRWFIIANIVVLLVTAALIYSGYQFFVAVETDQKVVWGVLLIVSLQMQIGIKQWLWQEMNRNSVMREIKRVELELMKLKTGLSSGR